ncbi:MAG: outer membrane beta-barrel family protein [Muribaculaceae bacterium]|nr:outer membrane beta-barrel family protein [Muribaculaceae bacterium]
MLCGGQRGYSFLGVLLLPAGAFTPEAFCQSEGNLSYDSGEVSVSVADSTVRELPEIEIKADKEIYRKDHVILKLSEENRRFGSNALDAISTLSRFVTVLNSPSLLSYDRRKVFVLVDGAPSSAEMLRTYQAGDIRDVEYYDTPPARYRVYTEGPVVNVRLRHRHDMQLSAYVLAQGALTDVLTSDMATLTYADSLNQAKVTYDINHLNNGGVSRSTVFDYPDGSSSREDTEGRNKLLSQSVNATYQRSQGRHVFNADARYNWRHDGFHYPGAVVSVGEDLIREGLTDRRTRSSQGLFSSDIYYSYTHSENRSLAVSVGNSFGKGDQMQNITRDIVTGELSSYRLHTATHNDTYNFSGTVSGSYPVGNVRMNGVLRYTHRNLRQTTDRTQYRSSADNEFLSVGSSWTKGVLRLSPAVGAEINTERTSAVHVTTVSPWGYLGISVRGRNRLRGASAMLTLSTSQLTPPASSTTDNYTYIDANFISRGNPLLRTGQCYNSEMKLQYFDPSGKWFVSFYGQLLYSHNAIVPLIYTEDDMVVLQSGNLRHSTSISFQLTGRWSIFSWLFAQPYIGCTDMRYDTPSSTVNRNNIRYGMSMTAMLGYFSITAAASSPVTRWSGDTYSRNEGQLYAAVSYRWRNWTFGTSYTHLMRGGRYGASGSEFSYCMRPYNGLYRNLVQLNVSWLFSRGRQFRHEGKSLGGVQGDVALPSAN